MSWERGDRLKRGSAILRPMRGRWLTIAHKEVGSRHRAPLTVDLCSGTVAAATRHLPVFQVLGLWCHAYPRSLTPCQQTCHLPCQPFVESDNFQNVTLILFVSLQIVIFGSCSSPKEILPRYRF